MKLICVGKVKEKFISDGINEYLKRLKPLVDLKLIEVKEFNTNNIDSDLNKEQQLIVKHIEKKDYVITLDIDGNNLSSVELAEFIEKINTYNHNINDLVFVIGSSHGLGAEVKQRSNYSLSFGKNTYPHQLMRLIFLEQLYRAFMINNNSKYHK